MAEVIVTEKACSKCKELKPVTEYFKHYSSYSPRCKLCLKVDRYNYEKRQPKKKRTYEEYVTAKICKERGITEGEYQKLLDEQDGKCAICKRPPNGIRLSLDHDHKTNKVRGFLCGNCNRGLGSFKDNVELLKTAIAYLITHN